MQKSFPSKLHNPLLHHIWNKSTDINRAAKYLANVLTQKKYVFNVLHNSFADMDVLMSS